MPVRRTLAAAAALTLITTVAAVPTVAQEKPGPTVAPSAVATGVPAPLGPPQATPNPEPLETPAGDGTAVRLTTELGDVVIGLFNESAPVAAENFLNLARAGYYDGVGFHRAVPGFVLQGGDPEGTGSGGPGYTIEDEEVVGRYGRGIVAMARTPQPNSQGSQFFFVLDDGAEGQLERFRTYVIFGRVVEGMDVVDAIVAAREPSHRISDPVRIVSTSVEQVVLPPEPTPPPPTPAELAAETLGAKVPGEVAGYPMQVATFTYDAVATQLPPDALVAFEEVVAENAGDIELFTIARADGAGEDGFATVFAMSVPGVDGAVLLDSMLPILMPLDGREVSVVEIGGREVTRVDMTPDPGPGESAFVFPVGDVVWFVITTSEDIESVVAELS